MMFGIFKIVSTIMSARAIFILLRYQMPKKRLVICSWFRISTLINDIKILIHHYNYGEE